jgi:hypothetical protein
VGGGEQDEEGQIKLVSSRAMAKRGGKLGPASSLTPPPPATTLRKHRAWAWAWAWAGAGHVTVVVRRELLAGAHARCNSEWSAE